MDLSRPLTAVLPSLEGPVLEVLARRSTPVTGREVHRLAATGSESGIRLVLHRLVEHGVVLSSQAGKATLYIGNRDHVAWPAVEILVRLRQNLFDRMRELVASWRWEPTMVLVFGSAARGDGNAASDVDLLVIHQHPGTPQWEDQIDDLREQVTAWTGNTCQIYDLTLQEFAEHARTREPIVTEWRRDGVVVFGSRLDRLVESEAV